MVFLRKYIPIFLALIILAYYLILAWVLHRSGYEHSESLFLAEKIRLLLQTKDNTIITLGTTFPSIVFLSSLVFVAFGYPFAPILAAAVFTTILFFLVLKDFSRTSIQRRFFIPMVTLLFIFHPGLIFAGTSGRGIAAVLLFFYLVFRSLFIYYKTQTTFSLSMASIYLTFLVFCNYNFIWLILAFIPFIVLVALDGLKNNIYGSPLDQYYATINNESQRRKLVNRTLAIYVVFILLPIAAVYLFKGLNYLHAGDSTYFLTSQYSNWAITGKESLGNIFSQGNEGTNILSQNHLIFQGYILLLTPLMIAVFVMFKGKLYELLTLLSPFIFISILLLDNQTYFTVEYYLIFLVLAFVGIYYYAGKKYTSKVMYPIIMLIALINIYTGIVYFRRTSDKEEKQFFAAIKTASKWNGERVITENFRLANYISGLATKENKILIDDAAAYSIVAQLRNLDNTILPTNQTFITAIENPKLGVKYLCIAKDSNRLRGFTVLNEYNLNQFALRQKLSTTLMFETKNWAIHRLNEE